MRAAASGDGAAVAPLLGELGYPAEPDDVRRRLERLADGADDHVFVAECLDVDGADGDAGVIVLGVLALHIIPVLHAGADLAWITLLVVADAARGRGVGRALVAAAEAAARKRGCARIGVTSALRRAGAHAFYERLGYQHTGRRFVKWLA